MLTAVFIATVISISDGDTLTVLKADKQQVKIRLAEIDAPEKGQPFGAQATQSLSDLCFGKQATVVPRSKDPYDRTIAHVSCNGIDANSAQVNRGMAWVYRKYAKDHNLYMLEHEAKRHKRGLWADKSPTPPWQWRKSPRYAAIQVAGKDDLAECARLLALNVAHYELRYGTLPLDGQLTLTGQFNGDQEELVIRGMETLAGILGNVIRGLDERLEH